jgi:hypothetical protein
LNPVAAKVADTPETSDYTSIKQRVDHADARGKTAQLQAAKGGSVAGSQAPAGVEDSLWLCPIEDRRGLDSNREGIMQGFSLGSYIKLVDYTGPSRFPSRLIDKQIASRFPSRLVLPVGAHSGSQTSGTCIDQMGAQEIQTVEASLHQRWRLAGEGGATRSELAGPLADRN